MPLRSDWTAEYCPIARSLQVLGGPWTVLVLRQAFSGVRRFDRFRTELGIADNVLSARLSARSTPVCCAGCPTSTIGAPATSTCPPTPARTRCR